MIELSIQLPDDLALRLRPVQDRLAEIIELGLGRLSQPQVDLYGELVEFLASAPTPQAIVAFRPSSATQNRVAELLDKNAVGGLTIHEQAELNQYETLDYLVTLVKARARQRLGTAN